MSESEREGKRLEGISPEVYIYRLGNRSVLEWFIDQYRVTEDKSRADTRRLTPLGSPAIARTIRNTSCA